MHAVASLTSPTTSTTPERARAGANTESARSLVSLFSRAAIALGTVLVAAKVAESHKLAQEGGGVDEGARLVRTAENDSHGKCKELPSEETLQAHLDTYMSNLARALELRRMRGDLTDEENRIVDEKFEEMRLTISMTEDLLDHVRAQQFAERMTPVYASSY